MIQSTQRKKLRLIIQTKKKVQKDCETTNEEKYTNDSSCSGDESEDGQISISHKDQDSDVSFESDFDEEMDTTEIEEEDWAELTNEVIEEMRNEKIKLLDQDSPKNELEIGVDNCNVTE